MVSLVTCTHKKTPPGLTCDHLLLVWPGTVDGGGLENNALRRQSGDGQVEPDPPSWLPLDCISTVLPVEVRRGAQGDCQTSPGDEGGSLPARAHILLLQRASRACMSYILRLEL